MEMGEYNEESNGRMQESVQRQSYAGQKNRDEKRGRIEELVSDVLPAESNGSVSDVRGDVATYNRERMGVGKTGNKLVDMGIDLSYKLGVITPEGMARKSEKKLEELARKYDGDIRAMKRDRDKALQELSGLEGRYDQAFELRELLKDEALECGAEEIKLDEQYRAALSNGSGYEAERTATEIRDDFYAKRKESETLKDQFVSVNFEIKRLDEAIKAKREKYDFLSALITSGQVSKMQKVDQARVSTIDNIGNSEYIIDIATNNEEADRISERHSKDIEVINNARKGIFGTISGMMSSLNGRKNGKISAGNELRKLTEDAGKFRDKLSEEVDGIQERRKLESLI